MVIYLLCVYRLIWSWCIEWYIICIASKVGKQARTWHILHINRSCTVELRDQSPHKQLQGGYGQISHDGWKKCSCTVSVYTCIQTASYRFITHSMLSQHYVHATLHSDLLNYLMEQIWVQKVRVQGCVAHNVEIGCCDLWMKGCTNFILQVYGVS